MCIVLLTVQISQESASVIDQTASPGPRLKKLEESKTLACCRGDKMYYRQKCIELNRTAIQPSKWGESGGTEVKNSKWVKVVGPDKEILMIEN